MNFFDAQDQARSATRWLIAVYAVATVLIVAGVTALVAAVFYESGAGTDPTTLATTAIVTALFIFGATIYKTSVLSGGGGRVATEMGGTLLPADVQDPLLRRLRNVVEEMAIASGVPVPDIYVLEKEAGINAFAAGFTPNDAAIAVTRGTLEMLDREELQGVIAHEFSHILNGDMRLNIRMMGVLFGIMALGLIGRMVLRGNFYSGIGSSRRSRGGSAIVLIGLGLTILGWIGLFFARLIKAAVSRQRELLADASAVQFTRQTEGIAGALKKIGGYAEHSYFRATDPEQVSHMLFAGGVPKLASLFATHPPLVERIKALDPSFRESDFPDVALDTVGDAMSSNEPARPADGSAAFATPPTMAIERNILESIGQPQAQHVAFARKLHGSIPETLYRATHSPSGAYLLTVALVINPSHAERQFSIVQGQLGEVRALQVRDYYEGLQKAGERYWLPLLELGLPALRQRPPQSLEFLVDLVRRLIELDGEVELREFCFYRIIAAHLRQNFAAPAKKQSNRVGKAAARRAAVALLRIVADQGSAEATQRDQAFRSGLRAFGDWAGEQEVSISPRETVPKLGEALDVLEKINPAGRKSLVEAVTRTVAWDNRLTISEAELLRAICAVLDCPLPPVLPTP